MQISAPDPNLHLSSLSLSSSSPLLCNSHGNAKRMGTMLQQGRIYHMKGNCLKNIAPTNIATVD
eukprot:4211101-Ditylum_brightwellii.AAC.1